MHYKIAQLILTPGQRTTSTSEVFVSQPDANKEALAGKLFALIEIESKRADDLKMVNFLLNTINHDYYQNEKIIMRERVSTLKVEHIFESALVKTNKKLAEFLQAEKINLNPRGVNITIGVVYQDALHFTNLGKNKALLIYRQRSNTKETKYKLTDISAKTSINAAGRQINLMKLFSNVISGAIPPGGYFIFTSETLPEYLSTKQMIDIITNLPPASAVEQIKNTLTKINAYVPFLAIIIKNTIGSDKLEPRRQLNALPTTQASIASLNIVEEKTEKLLTPSGLINFGKWRTNLTKVATRIWAKSPQSAGHNKLLFLKDKILTKKRPSWLSGKKFWRIGQDAVLYFLNIVIYLFKLITDKEKLKTSWQTGRQKIDQTIVNTQQSTNRLIIWFKRLERRNKILLAVGLACLGLLVINLGWSIYQNQQSKKQIVYNDLVQQVEQKQNQIDASLLYGNNEGAKKLLNEIKTLLASLPQNTAAEQEQLAKLQAKNQVQTEKISRIIRVDSPIELANFINLNSQAKPTNIILAKGKIYAADAEQKSIYSLEIANNLITAIADISQSIKGLNYPSLDKDNNIYYKNSTNIIKLAIASESLVSLAVEYSGDWQQCIDIKMFNNRLYCLAPTNNQIIRFNKAMDKFTSPANWLNNNIDLTSAISMDIDGRIYVLKNNGELMKFLKGAQEDFNLEPIEPALSQANKILVSPEKKFVYLLDTANQRLIVFDKTGKFINQYTSAKFNDLKDFIINEAAKKIYLLNGTSVFAIDAEHLSTN